uniref:Granulins domain-containing protein n=1 Tax=Esox lucius TaxID=8010 RepID=A0A3P8Y7L9_ESOLU
SKEITMILVFTVKTSQTSCSDGTTCCRLASGSWGCCPSPHAVCCKDGLHCCPYGYRCSNPFTQCVRSDGLRTAEGVISPSLPLLQSYAVPLHRDDPQLDISVSLVWCDSRTSCPDGTTCCRLASGSWGCCPFPSGVCCWDGLHCCPYGYRCTVPMLGCVRSDGLRYPFIPKQTFSVIKATKVSKPENEVSDEVPQHAT